MDKAGQEGLLEGCRGGTIFLDEIHGVPEDFQRFLLDVVEHKPFSRHAGDLHIPAPALQNAHLRPFRGVPCFHPNLAGRASTTTYITGYGLR